MRTTPKGRLARFSEEPEAAAEAVEETAGDNPPPAPDSRPGTPALSSFSCDPFRGADGVAVNPLPRTARCPAGPPDAAAQMRHWFRSRSRNSAPRISFSRLKRNTTRRKCGSKSAAVSVASVAVLAAATAIAFFPTRPAGFGRRRNIWRRTALWCGDTGVPAGFPRWRHSSFGRSCSFNIYRLGLAFRRFQVMRHGRRLHRFMDWDHAFLVARRLLNRAQARAFC